MHCGSGQGGARYKPIEGLLQQLETGSLTHFHQRGDGQRRH